MSLLQYLGLHRICPCCSPSTATSSVGRSRICEYVIGGALCGPEVEGDGRLRGRRLTGCFGFLQWLAGADREERLVSHHGGPTLYRVVRGLERTHWV